MKLLLYSENIKSDVSYILKEISLNKKNIPQYK